MQNQVLETIAERRSIRAYREEQITEAQLQALLDAVRAAPSARNTQPWHVSAVQKGGLIRRVNEAFRAQMLATCAPEDGARYEDASYSVFYHAPTVLFFSCPPLGEMAYAHTDTGIAIQSVALAAQSMGLGSVILGMPRMAFAGPEGEALRAALHFPEGYGYCLSIAIGIPAMTKEAHPELPGRFTILR